MSKLFSILLIFIVTLGSVIDMRDFAKLPHLIDHYNQHKSKTDHFSFSEFFDLHYGTKAEEHDKEERGQHKGLPFKMPDHTSIHSTIFIVECLISSLKLPSTEVNYTNFYQCNSSSEFRQSIFQPPRKA